MPHRVYLTELSDLADEFDHDLNHPVQAADVRSGGEHPFGASYWWRCPTGPDHVWRATVVARRTGRGCPCCRGLIPSVTNDLNLFPLIAEQLDPALNDGLTPDQVVAGSSRKLTWRCPVAPDHVWGATPAHRTGGGTGCPACRGRLASSTNNLTLHPRVLAEYDPALNNGVPPEQVKATESMRKVTWCCATDAQHVWEATPRSRVIAGHGCGFCSGRYPTASNNLAAAHPAVAAEWHPTRNAGAVPSEYTPTSGRKVWWLCSKNSTHEWDATIASRTFSGTGCPRCSRGWTRKSLPEVLLASELALHVAVNPDPDPVVLDDGSVERVDIVLPEMRTVVEYDGRYWHRDQARRDRDKTTRLTDDGWVVIRVREHPLPPVCAHDVVVDESDIVAAVAGVLERIADLGCTGLTAAIAHYRDGGELRAENAGYAQHLSANQPHRGLDGTALRARYEAGEYLADLAREASVWVGTTRAAIVAAGGSIRPSGGRVALDEAEVLSRWDSGAAVGSIAQDLGTYVDKVVECLLRGGRTYRDRQGRTVTIDVQAVRSDYEAGMPAGSVAARHQIPKGWVRPALIVAGANPERRLR